MACLHFCVVNRFHPKKSVMKGITQDFVTTSIQTIKTNTMKKITVCIALMVSITSIAQQARPVPLSVLQSLNGKWKGTLLYTDYQDDKKQVTMGTRTENKLLNDSMLLLQAYYTEPNSTREFAASKPDTITISDGGRSLTENGYETAARIVKNKMKGGIRTIIIEGMGTDNDRPSFIRRIFIIGKDQFSVEKLIRYEGSTQFIRRNKYSFNRQ
jgi:hypothetical protein